MGSSSCANVAEEELGALPRAITAISQLMQQSAQADAQAATQCVRLTSRAILGARNGSSRSVQHVSGIAFDARLSRSTMRSCMTFYAATRPRRRWYTIIYKVKPISWSVKVSRPQSPMHACMCTSTHAHTTVSTGTTVDCQPWR